MSQKRPYGFVRLRKVVSKAFIYLKLESCDLHRTHEPAGKPSLTQGATGRSTQQNKKLQLIAYLFQQTIETSSSKKNKKKQKNKHQNLL